MYDTYLLTAVLSDFEDEKHSEIQYQYLVSRHLSHAALFSLRIEIIWDL